MVAPTRFDVYSQVETNFNVGEIMVARPNQRSRTNCILTTKFQFYACAKRAWSCALRTALRQVMLLRSDVRLTPSDTYRHMAWLLTNNSKYPFCLKVLGG